jgi:N-methylhydantoinase A/oxoprolinase/acetone carboxylase beta subunit
MAAPSSARRRATRTTNRSPFLESSADALSPWRRHPDEVYPQLVTCVYSGTAMLNRVVQRKGLDVAFVTTATRFPDAEITL